MKRRLHLSAVLAAFVVLLLQLALTPAAAAPEPGRDRALFGGPLNLYAKEGALGRALDVVRIYSVWETGPPAVPSAVSSVMASGERTVLLSASIPWHGWQTTARRLNSDGDPTNDVPEPYCGTRPIDPLTGRASGKTWFGAVAAGHYDARLRSWLRQLADLSSRTPSIYVSFHHEADRLDDASHSSYQACVGTASEYRAAWRRIRLVAEGAVGPGGADLTRRGGGPVVFVPIYTAWGFWHTAGSPGNPERVLTYPATGLPKPGPEDDMNLYNARVTPWVPAAQDYDILAADVFNYSGSAAGGGIPTRVRVDDPATTTRESDQWRSLAVLIRPVTIWADNHAARPDGSTRPLMLAEYGSVPDPTRPARRADWVAAACRYLSDPANARFHGALYFDVNQMRLSTWKWTKVAAGTWSAIGSPTGTDTVSVGALAEMGASARFSGSTAACP